MTDTTDLISRLRLAGGQGADLSPGDPLCAEAADTIERLQRDRDSLRKQLADEPLRYAQMSAQFRAISEAALLVTEERDRLQRDYAELLAQTTDTDVENRRLRAALEQLHRRVNELWETVPAVPRAQPGSYERGRITGVTDTLRALSPLLEAPAGSEPATCGPYVP